MAHSRLRWLTQVGAYTTTPYAFIIVIIYAAGWAYFGKLDAAGIATLTVWTMTLFIQRSQHRDTQAIHAKLDELLRAVGDARNELTELDEDEPEQIEEFREQERAGEPRS